MLLVSASFAPDLSTVAIVFTAAAGVLAALVAMLKLRGETGNMAVSQAQGAMETMVELNNQLEKALKRANERADRYREDRDKLHDELDAVQEQLDRKE